VLRFGSVTGSNAGTYTSTYLTGSKTALNTVTLDTVGEWAMFVATEDGAGTFKWSLAAGVGLAVT
jgi:uncharacterized protein YjdB